MKFDACRSAVKDKIEHLPGISESQLIECFSSRYKRSMVQRAIKILEDPERTIIRKSPSSRENRYRHGFYPNITKYRVSRSTDTYWDVFENKVWLEELKLAQEPLKGITWIDKDDERMSFQIEEQIKTCEQGFNSLDGVIEVEKLVPLPMNELVEAGFFKDSDYTGISPDSELDGFTLDRPLFSSYPKIILKALPGAKIKSVLELKNIRDPLTFSSEAKVMDMPGFILAKLVKERIISGKDWQIIGMDRQVSGDIVVLTNIRYVKDGFEIECHTAEELQEAVSSMIGAGKTIRLVISAEEPSGCAFIDHSFKKFPLLHNSLFVHNHGNVHVVKTDDETVETVMKTVGTEERNEPTIVVTVNQNGKKMGNEFEYGIGDIIRNNNHDGNMYTLVSMNDIGSREITYGIRDPDFVIAHKKIGKSNINRLRQSFKQLNGLQII